MVTVLERSGTSLLHWAMANDVDAYQAAKQRQGTVKQRKPDPPETFEWTWDVQILASLFSLLQQQIHVTATHGTRAIRKKPKIQPWPTPITAVQRAKRAEARKAYETIERLLVFTDDPEVLGYDPQERRQQQKKQRPRSMGRTVPRTGRPQA